MPRRNRRRGLLLWLAAARAVLAVIAIPLAPFLYREHFLILVLLRPTKEVFLAAGFLIRRGDINVPAVLAASFPLMALGVWLFFFLGRAYRDEIDRCDLPGLGGKLLPPGRITHLRTVIERKGTKIVFLGRLAAFPSTLVAAAAGSCDTSARRFLVADGLGAAAAIVEVVGAGYLLGAAYKDAGPWLTGAGVVVLATVAVVVGRAIRKTSDPAAPTATAHTPTAPAAASGS